MNYDVGDLVKLELQARDESGELRDPTKVELQVREPGGGESSQVWPAGTVQRSAVGIFFATVLITEDGVWLYEWQCTGALEFTEPGELVAREDRLEEGRPIAVPWRPDTKDVAALIHARTITSGGFRIGDFTDETEPTGEAVERLTNIACRTVASGAGSEPCNAELRADARAVAAYLAAALVEQSYWPEQSIAATSTYAGLMKLAETNLATLETRVRANCGGGEDGDGEIEGGAAVAGNFDDGVEIIGRDYPWRW